MSYKITFLYIATLVLVFFFGFFCGIRYEQVKSPDQADSGVAPAIRTESKTDPENVELSEEERRILKALEDPEFKKIHDLLIRENPIQMDLALPEPDSQKDETPISDRPPVQFSLP